MVRQRSCFRVALLLLTAGITGILLFGSAAQAAGERVVDQANIFSLEQEQQLEQAAAELGAEYAMDVVIVTTSDTEGKSSMAYADDFFDYNGYGVGETYDGVLMLMDFQNRMVWISTSGKAIDVLTDQRIERILDAMEPGMINSDYMGAAQAFLSQTGDYFKGNTLTFVESIIGLLVSGGAGAGVIGSIRNRYKGKASRPVFAYQNNSLIDMGIVANDLVNTYTTSRIIPRPTSSSGRGGGGSSTHTSSSGRSHGGGGRGF